MKISLNWLKKYVTIPEEVSDEELVRLIGARLVEVEGVIDETHKYDNIYIVKVVGAEKIPETHLTLCRVDAGEDELVQVVCGAPNVREGMLAVWIKPGAIVPASVNEDAPFVIGKRKMQGYESCGMLAGADELDLGDDHSGIVEIDSAMAKPGDLLADVFELKDLILDIENKSLTHRPDCFGMIGFAREVSGLLGEEFGSSLSGYDVGSARRRGRAASSSSVVTSGDPRKATSELLEINIANSDICSRYSAVVLEKHGELKRKYLTWVDTILAKSGMKPISPIVDATNYLMLLTGQPLHAFDYDKFVKVGGAEKAKIEVRLAREGEKLVLLDEKEVELNENDIVICSNDVPVALAGAMGGESTAVDENTKKIILESATFSLYNLRKTGMAHGIFSEAITRFTKGQPAYQTLAVAGECAKMLSSGFKVVEVVDEYPNPEKLKLIKINSEEINGLLGTDYDENLITKTLRNVGFEVKKKDGELEIEAPEWRTDIHIKEDIIEEVGRLLGYDNIPVTLPLHATAEKNAMWELKKKVREVLARFGANEVLTYSFVSGKLLKKAEQDPKNSYRIVNSISPELQYIRQSLVPSLLDKAYMNEKLPVEEMALFEMNQVYDKRWGVDEDGVSVPRMALGCVLAERKNRETAFYKAKWYVAKLLEELGVEVEFLPIIEMESGYESKRSAVICVEKEVFGIVGELKNSVRHEFKLAEYVAGFEIDLGEVLRRMSQKRKIRFGAKKKIDETVTTDKSYATAEAELKQKYPGAKITPGGVYQAPGQKTRNITFHVEF